MPTHLDRRRFMALSAAAGAASAGGLLAPRRSRAGSASDRKFIFIFNNGGWDPTRVFATAFDNADIDMEAEAELATAGGISYVDHPGRPSVRDFMEAHHASTVVVNGMQVRSIAHEICTMIAMTGGTSGLDSDWPAIIAAAASDRYTLPHLVLGGPSFPGELGTSVARTGAYGQLEALLSGEIVEWSDQSTAPLDAPSRSIIDAYIRRRAAGRVARSGAAVDQQLALSFQDALSKASGIKDYRYVMDFTGGTSVLDQAAVAVDALSLGLSRCVTLGHPGTSGGLGWDTHADNDDTQSQLFEALFSGLGPLMDLLATTPGEVAATLAEETVVVVLSEMGRTAQLNATLGKDHWPYTSMLLVGPGLDGGRVVGAYDQIYAGELVDLATGEVEESGRILSVEAVGAALLQLADVDPSDYLSDADPLTGILA